ncbi:hypothetical protein BJ912DRAFT_467768 [Pholiota molesta]|nr:hypothetical protein BJ912DRAFT_467768 [Pholiota molesta]
MLSPTLLLTSFFIASAIAANDWSKPCLSGVCEYDLPETNSSASGTLKIWSSNAAAISDITPAAGWTILGCAPDALDQEIRLVCTGGGNCAHLYSETGAVGKVIRLPENCGKSPFAVVNSMYKSRDQSLPASVSRRALGSNATVHALSISTKFSRAGSRSTGTVNFAIRAANVPGAAGNLPIPTHPHGRANSRAFRFPRGADKFVPGVINDFSLNDFNVNKSTTLPPFDIDQPFNLVNQTVSCPPVAATVKIDVNAKTHAVATIGVAASGTILPPNVDSFAVIVGLDASIDGTVTMLADVSGTLDSGKLTLFEVGVPGLDFPGILTIGPSFKIDAQATAKLDLGVDLTVGLNYNINGAQLVFPPNSGATQNQGAFNIGDTPLKLSAPPSVTATGTLAAHLIPSLNLGLSALGNTVSTTVFLALDASASMALSATASTPVGRRALRYSRDVENVMARQSDAAIADSTADTTATATIASPNASAGTARESPKALDASPAANPSLGGCFEIDTILDVNAGATGSFFGLFDATTKVDLFQKKFEIFKKCLGSQPARRSLPNAAHRSLPLLGTRSLSVSPPAFTLQCPSPNSNASGGKQSVADQTVAASSIH